MKLQYRAGEGENLFITTKVYYNTEARNKQDEGKLYTFWHREINPKQGECYDFLSVKGRGHYVGKFIMPKDCIQIIWYFLKETIPLM